MKMNAMKAWPVYVAVTLCGVVSSVSFGQASADALAACTALKDEKARLQCYDEQMARVKEGDAQPNAAAPASSATPPVEPEAPTATQTSAPEASPAAPAAAAKTPAAQPSDEFGFDPKTIRRKRAAENPDGQAEPTELVARVKSVSKRAYGEYRIELDNGQVWVETLRTGGLAPKEGEEVTIKRGALGSYYLTPQTGLALRVKRIK